MRISELLALCRREMAARGIPASAEAEFLAAHLAGVPRARLLLEADREVGDPRAALRDLVVRRARGEPLQYLLGAWDFYGREFLISRETLIPRPETEGLVEGAIACWRTSGRGEGLVLDVGTGCGAIAATLVAELPGVRAVGVDLSAGALAVARENVRRLGLAGRILLVRGDGYSALKRGDRFDLVISNPPYVSDAEWARLPAEVRDFEPAGALLAGPDGLDLLRRLVAGAEEVLQPGGELRCEIGEGQAGAVERLPAGNLIFAGVSKDLAGRDRVARWVRPSGASAGR